MFYFNVPEKSDNLNTLKVSGLANIPKGNRNYPIIIMFRGYLPKETYKSGGGVSLPQKFLPRTVLSLLLGLLGLWAVGKRLGNFI